MIKRAYHIVLLLTLVLSIMGNTVRAGVCPCSGSVFFGDCSCNLKENCPNAPSGDACSCQGKHKEAGKTSSPHAPGKASGEQSCGSLCDNQVLEVEALYVVDSATRLPCSFFDVISSSPIWNGNADLIDFSRQVWKTALLKPPLCLFSDTRLIYEGFMRPVRA